MRRIRTVFREATDERGRMVRASSVDSDTSFLLPWDYSLTYYGNHEKAALELLRITKNLKGRWVGVSVENGYHFVRIFKSSGNRRIPGDLIELAEDDE